MSDPHFFPSLSIHNFLYVQLFVLIKTPIMLLEMLWLILIDAAIARREGDVIWLRVVVSVLLVVVWVGETASRTIVYSTHTERVVWKWNELAAPIHNLMGVLERSVQKNWLLLCPLCHVYVDLLDIPGAHGCEYHILKATGQAILLDLLGRQRRASD